MAKFTAVGGKSKTVRIISVQAVTEELARMEIIRQLSLNRQRREILTQWSTSGADIVEESRSPFSPFEEVKANALMRGRLRELLAELETLPTDSIPTSVAFAFVHAQEALNEYDRGMSTHYVSEANSCPSCGEGSMDRLLWREDGQNVRCVSCGTIYEPGE